MTVLSEQQSRRLSALAGHFVIVESGNETDPGVAARACAATQLTAYARPTSTGARFARPAGQQFSRDERVLENALLYGDGVLSGLKSSPPKPLRNHKTLPHKSESRRGVEGRTENTYSSISGWAPQVHVIVGRNSFTYTFLLPGVKAGDIRLQLDGANLSISGRRVSGITYTHADIQRSDIPILQNGRPSSETRGQARAARLPAAVNRADFAATWLLPDGDFSRMRAQYASEKLRVVLPARRPPA